MKAFKAIMSVSLAVTLLLSSIGFSVSRHYCLGMLAEESFYHLGNESCEMPTGGCEAVGDHLETHCCEDENLAIPGVQIQNRSNEDMGFSLTKSEFPPAIASHTFKGAFNLSLPNTPSAHAPPDQFSLTGRDILIHDQRFLI